MVTEIFLFFPELWLMGVTQRQANPDGQTRRYRQGFCQLRLMRVWPVGSAEQGPEKQIQF